METKSLLLALHKTFEEGQLKEEINNAYARAKFLGLSDEQFLELCEQAIGLPNTP